MVAEEAPEEAEEEEEEEEKEEEEWPAPAPAGRMVPRAPKTIFRLEPN